MEGSLQMRIARLATARPRSPTARRKRPLQLIRRAQPRRRSAREAGEQARAGTEQEASALSVEKAAGAAEHGAERQRKKRRQEAEGDKPAPATEPERARASREGRTRGGVPGRRSQEEEAPPRRRGSSSPGLSRRRARAGETEALGVERGGRASTSAAEEEAGAGANGSATSPLGGIPQTHSSAVSTQRWRRPMAGGPVAACAASPIAGRRGRGREDFRSKLSLVFDRRGLLPRHAAATRRGDPRRMRPCSTAEEASVPPGFALQDEWYQDVTPDDLGSLLRTGVLWTHPETGYEWALAGPREIFVLTSGTTHRGFVSCPRLTLGHEHAVLCTTSQLPAVESALQKAGCAQGIRFGEKDGAPPGWVLLTDTDRMGRPKGIVPTSPVPLEEGSES